MKVVYFASLRERLGLTEEDLELPPEARTVADVISFLAKRDEIYEAVFSSGLARVALDKRHAKPDTAIAGVSEIAFFPPMTGG
ncbi:molybdopterin synthase sulfur carrier subunit [Rhodoblastus acidophilus]|uniref:molybdopterin converting factor subunit 1 n=1 Tax=Rhodoblastus acidophilus TaxID=1074 RepID=UPI0022242C2A|nr:molybdopterin converting factor subunit 1 [Rhodoblastus acidophilus]MCW2285457.1 molybdopterin synthase sulfur carrier subunit [Rhodoblastus acidophilus]MCW2334459.1 molybdopterin synthase sulfur carrier subunit [Rhodoblastus acidophilus]